MPAGRLKDAFSRHFQITGTKIQTLLDNVQIIDAGSENKLRYFLKCKIFFSWFFGNVKNLDYLCILCQKQENRGFI